MSRLLAVIFVAAFLIVPVASAGSSQTFVVSPSAPTVGNTVTGSGCGYIPNHWFRIDTYGPNTTVDGPLDSTNIGRVDSNGCIGGPLLNPAQESGTYSSYVYDCGGKASGSGCQYGSRDKVLVDVDFIVS